MSTRQSRTWSPTSPSYWPAWTSSHMVAPPGSLVVVGGGRTPLLLGRATSGKSTFPTGPVNPVFSNSSTFHEVAGAVLLLAYCSVIHFNRKYILHYVHSCFLFCFCILVIPETNKKYVITWSDQNVIGLMPILPCKRSEVTGQTWHNTCRQLQDMQWAVYIRTVSSRWLLWIHWPTSAQKV